MECKRMEYLYLRIPLTYSVSPKKCNV
jgi:hypothetical protein